MELIRTLMYDAIVQQLNVPYPARGYNGQAKQGVSPRKASGNLIDSLEVKWVDDFSSDPNAPEPLLVAEMDEYYYFVDQGRKPSLKYPPLASIERWTKIKPLPRFRDKRGRFITNKTRTFLAARSIKEKGYKGINFLTKAENQVIRQLVDAGELLAAAFFEEAINKGLITARAKQ